MDPRFTQHRQRTVKYMRPYEPGEDVSHVSISEPDLANGSPKQGDWIATNPSNPGDEWLVAAAYYDENLEPA